DERTVLCPWRNEHTTGKPTASILPAKDGKRPAFHCFHNHCKARKLKDVCLYFGKARVEACCQRRFWSGGVTEEQEERLRQLLEEPPQEVAEDVLTAPWGKILTWSDMKQRAKAGCPHRVIEGLIGVGEVSLLCGLPWSGKATVLAKAV